MPRDNGKLTYGQQYDEQTGVVRSYTQIVQNVPKLEQPVAAIGQEKTEVTPLDANAAKVTTWDMGAFADELLNKTVISYPSQLSFELPAVLKGVTVIYNPNSGDGTDTSTGSGYASGDPYQLALESSARSNGSGSIIPDLILDIDTPQANNVPGTTYELYMANGFSLAELLAKVGAAAGTSVSAWPVFKTKPLTFSLLGKSASLAASASVRVSQYRSDDSSTDTSTQGVGESTERGVTIRTKDVSPTLHAAITLSGTSSTATISAAASTGWTGTGLFPSASSSSTPTPIVLTASVTPTSIAATSPADIPRTGFYLVTHSQQPVNSAEVIAVVATVVNMAIFS